MFLDQLFQKIGLWDMGIASFEEADRCCSHLIPKAKEIYCDGDEAFGCFITALSGETGIHEPALNLYFYIHMSQDTFRAYQQLGIPEVIFYETMQVFSCVSRMNYEKTGQYGIPSVLYRWWIRRNLECKIFRLKNLEFEIADSWQEIHMDDIHIAKGEPAIWVHIPRYVPLDEALCEEAYAAATEFFPKYFSMPVKGFLCHSWLLHPWLMEELPENARICKFQSHYITLDIHQEPEAVIDWIFQKREANPEDYPEATALQRAYKARLQKGLPLGTALAFRP